MRKITALRRLTWMLLIGLCLGRMPYADAQTASSFAPPAAPSTVPSETTTFPYTPQSPTNSPLIQVKLNDKVTVTFLLDTGTSFTMISDKVAAQLGLTPIPGVQDGKPFMMDGKQVNIVTPATTQMGELQLPNIPMVIFPEKSITAVAGPGNEGILGTNVLGFAALLLDPIRHQITLWFPGGLSSTSINAAFQAVNTSPLSALPLTENKGIYSVKGQFFNGNKSVSGDLAVDTGATTSFVTADLAHQLLLKPNTPLQSSHMVQGDYSETFAPVDSFHLGDIAFTTLQIGYFAGTAPKNSATSSLGMDILARDPLLIDFPAKQLYLSNPDPAQTSTSPINTSQAPYVAADVAFQTPPLMRREQASSSCRSASIKPKRRTFSLHSAPITSVLARPSSRNSVSCLSRS